MRLLEIVVSFLLNYGIIFMLRAIINLNGGVRYENI